MKTWTLITVLLASVILNACSSSSGKNNSASDPNLIPVSLMDLEQTEVASPIKASGQFTTNDETFLSFKTGGIIEKITVKEGDPIRKGQLLATLNLTEINAQVSLARLESEKAKRDFERATRLYRDSVATLEQYQNAKTGLDVATQRLKAAEFNSSYSEIRAIDNGFVLRKVANEGQVISSGSPVLQTNSGKEGNWILRVGLSDREWSRVSIGDKAEISLDASPNQTFTAIVQRKAEGADPYSGTFGIDLKLTGKLPTTIASGLFGKATITPSRKQNAWRLPYEAILDGDADQGYVFVTNDKKTALKQSVTIDAIEKDYVVVTGGLENAAALIISGSAYLKDNSPIRVINIQ